MIRIGTILIVFGFGSVVLRMMDMDFRLLSWLDGAQPTAGWIIGAVGVGLVIAGILADRRKSAAAPVTGANPFTPPAAGSYPAAPQQYGDSGQTYPHQP